MIARPDPTYFTDQHDHIMSDHDHLYEIWAESGQNEFDLESAKVYKYKDKLDKEGRFFIQN